MIWSNQFRDIFRSTPQHKNARPCTYSGDDDCSAAQRVKTNTAMVKVAGEAQVWYRTRCSAATHFGETEGLIVHGLSPCMQHSE